MEFEDYLMSQLVFKFPFKTKYYEQDFYVSSNNFSAYKLIESWPKWPGKWLNVFGLALDVVERNVDFPAFGRPTIPISAINFNLK